MTNLKQTPIGKIPEKLRHVLIDTNIFIYREDHKVIPENLRRLLKILNELGVKIFVHPCSIEDIKSDKDENRKKIILSKIATYPKLKSPPDATRDNDFLNSVGRPSRSNDYADINLLYAIYRNVADFLITEDKGIYKKAVRLNIKNRVLSIKETLEILEKQYEKKKIKQPPALKDEFIYNLDLNDPFFDSLKKEYPSFGEWFNEKAKEHRKCWVYYGENQKIGALLIYKLEDGQIYEFDPPFPKKKRLKLCTFKVTRTGYRIGELFIKLSVNYAIENEVEEIYLTHFTKENDVLVNLITEYGFQKVAKNKKYGDDVYVKELFPSRKKLEYLSPLEISKKFWPILYDGSKVNKFIVPIIPKYHELLFIEYGRQTKLYEHSGEFIIEGNTIKKAYLCHSRIRDIKPGDILLFYRSKDKKAITSIGVIEEVYHDLTDWKRIMDLVKKRTVYSKEDIKEMAKKSILVILFTWHFYFPTPVTYEKLREKEIIKWAPLSIINITHENYIKIKKDGGLDECFTID